MLIFVAHSYGGQWENVKHAAAITHDLQVTDPDNCYICPLLTFAHMSWHEMGFRAEMDLCLDILSACDKMIVASEITSGIYEELDFAQMVGIPVEYLF